MSVECKICRKEFGIICINHLKKHNITCKEYKDKFPNAAFFDDEEIEKRRRKFLEEGSPAKNPEIAKKISQSCQGRIPWNKGLSWSQDIKNKISKKLIGRKRPEIFGNKSPTKSAEVRTKISKSRKGKCCGDLNPSKRPEVRIKISKANKGKSISEETKKKISISRKNSQKGSGENHYNFNNWSSRLPYCNKWNSQLKERIRKRDDYICQLCNKTQKENNEKLSVHHIHYDKENCYPDLITLCRNCNSRVNTNRNCWEQYFMEILNKKELLNYFGELK